MCPGSFRLPGHGQVALTGAGFAMPGAEIGSTELRAGGEVLAHMSARAYFADSCVGGAYSNARYSAMRLLGKVLRYTTDVSGAGCGCNAALYLVPMRQNEKATSCNDYYCDVSKVCGVSCAEVDIQEANKHAWHSTIHGASDSTGMGGGYGGGANWNGARDFTNNQYGPGSPCIDTLQPIDVAVSFPTNPQGQLKAMQVTLTQRGRDCPLTINLASYANMSEISAALGAGMTPVINYWKSKDMLWMDGKGADGKGPCAADGQRCGDSVKFYNFAVEPLRAPGPARRPAPRPAPAAAQPAPQPAPAPAQPQPAADGSDQEYRTVVVQVPASQLPAAMRLGGEVGVRVGGQQVRAEVLDVRPVRSGPGASGGPRPDSGAAPGPISGGAGSASLEATVTTLAVAAVALAALGAWRLYALAQGAPKPGEAGAPSLARRWLQAGQGLLEAWGCSGGDKPPTPTSRTTTWEGGALPGAGPGHRWRPAPVHPPEPEVPEPWWRSYGGGTRSFPTPRDQTGYNPRRMQRTQVRGQESA